jgi:DNA (cytosine-5)-methyltransferase 1
MIKTTMLARESDKVISLFSGAGGFSYGFMQAGLKPICGSELSRDACETYEQNIGGSCHNIDLSTASPTFFRDLLQGQSPFAVIGGPPCQGFSTAGGRNKTDPRNKLIFNYLNIVEALQPQWFIFENVEGLLTSGHGDAVVFLVKEFLRIGYSVRVQKVNFAAYGVPQSRKRVLIIGNRFGADFQFPTETNSFDSGKARKLSGKQFAPTLDDALSGLGNAADRRNTLVKYQSLSPQSDFDHLMREGNITGLISEHFDTSEAKDIARYELLRPGQTMKDLPENYWHNSFKRRAFRRVMDGTPTERRGGAPSGIKRLHGDRQSLTITGAASREFIHPIENRPLTIRECARLQTFPDSYNFQGNAASVAQQIGNAFPAMASQVFALHLQELDGLFGSGKQVTKTVQNARLLGFVLTESSGMSGALKKTESLLVDLLQYEAGIA